MDFFESGRFGKIARFIEEEKRKGKSILPTSRNILRALSSTPPDEVRVVILGQDPYPTKGHANGLCFSVNAGVTKLPKSLINIFSELKDDLGIIKETGDLGEWALQGVLLLNSSLTVVEGEPGSHSGIGWEGLSLDVIRYLNENSSNIVYILWGKHAQEKEMYIDAENNLILKAPHPSPRSAYRGFFGSKPFSQTNKYLEEVGKRPISW